MRLSILGPAFGLPSIDADCIAAVALVKSHCEETGQSWELCAGYDDVAGASFPFLVDGSRTIRGTRRIAKYLGPTSQLSEKQTADNSALAAFIESNGQPLLDISLYVSYENYSARTRSALTRILPWYANYILPPKRKAAARARTEHLGVSSLDIDNVHEDVIEKPQGLSSQTKGQDGFEHETEKRARTLLGRRETVRSMLQKPEYAGAFRLKALADAFFEPLQAFLSNNDFMLGTTEPTDLDYVAYGYLGLMLYPQMVHNWLADTMRKRYTRLTAFVERMSTRLAMQIDEVVVSALFQKQDFDNSERMSIRSRSGLPWVRPTSGSPLEVASYIGSDILSRIPVLGSTDVVANAPRPKSEENSLSKYLPGLLGLASTALALGGYWIYKHELWPRGESVQIFGRKRLTDYGEAGAALAALGSQINIESEYKRRLQDDSPVHVDVIVDEEPRL